MEEHGRGPSPPASLDLDPHAAGAIDGDLARKLEAEPPPINTKVIRVGHRHVLVARPHPRAFGRQGIEILYSLAYARLMELPVCLIWPSEVASDALLHVTTPEVRMLTSRRERLVPYATVSVSDAFAVVQRLRQRVVDRARYEMGRRLRPPRRRLSVARTRARGRSEGEWGPAVTYDRRRLLVDPVTTTLRGGEEHRALELAAGFGLDADSLLVCLHVRERGYKIDAELRDNKPGGWDESVRNGRIEACMAAVDYLVERGYTVIRIGDSSMTPVTRPGLIDLATSPQRDQLLELWCLLKSHFLISAESGPRLVSYLTNTPVLTINATDPIEAFPIRPDGLYMLKRIVERETRKPLSPSSLLTEKHLRHLRDPEHHQFIENTPDQIVEAVEEMLELLRRHPPESPGQTWYRGLVAEAAGRLDRGYVGYGRLVRPQADQWFETDTRVTPAPNPSATHPS